MTSATIPDREDLLSQQLRPWRFRFKPVINKVRRYNLPETVHRFQDYLGLCLIKVTFVRV